MKLENKSLSEQFGLNKRTQLVQINTDSIGIIKQRKSRIIMKDGKQILEIANQIWKKDKGIKIALIISGPICSKTTAFMHQHNIDILIED